MATNKNSFFRNKCREMKVVLLFLLMCSAQVLHAYDFEVGGIKYEIISLEEMTCKVISNTTPYTGQIIIPAYVEYNNRTFTVEEIGNAAFSNCYDITEVHLEEAYNIKKINNSAFKGCSNIKSIVIPSNCEFVYSDAFYDCTSLEQITIQESETPLILQPKEYDGSLKSTTLYYYFGHFAKCPIKTLEILRDIQYGGLACEYNKLDTNRGNRIMSVYYFPWVDSCTESLTIGSKVTKVPYNLLLTLNPQKLILQDSEISLDIEPNTTYVYTGQRNQYGEYSINADGYIYIKGESNDIHRYYRGIKMSKLEYIYWGRNIRVSAFYCNANSTAYNKNKIQLSSSNLNTFELGNTLHHFGDIDVINSAINNIIWNDVIEECGIFDNVPLLTEIKFPESLKEISNFNSAANLEKVHFGSNLNKISGFAGTVLKTITIPAITPPELSAFNDKIFIESELFVPSESLNLYSEASGWKNFWNLQGFAPTGVKSIRNDAINGNNIYYDLNGNRLDAPKRGLNIINGKKVIVK